MKDGVVSVAGIRKIKGGFAKEGHLHINEGLVYEVSKGNKQLQFGVIPDIGVMRGFPNPNPTKPEESGHSIKEMDDFSFNVRVASKDLSISSIRRLKIDLFRAKGQIENTKVSAVKFEKQFDDKLRKVASLKQINLLKLPNTMKKSFEAALKK